MMRSHSSHLTHDVFFQEGRLQTQALYKMYWVAQDTSGDVKCHFSILSLVLLLLFLGATLQGPAGSGSIVLERV